MLIGHESDIYLQLFCLVIDAWADVEDVIFLHFLVEI